MNPLLRQGKKGIQDELAMANKYHAFVGTKQLKTMGDLRRAERERFYAMQGLQIQLATKVVPAFTAVIAKVTSLTRWFSDLPGPIKTVGIVAALALGPMAGMIGRSITLVKTLTGWYKKLAAAEALAGAAGAGGGAGKLGKLGKLKSILGKAGAVTGTGVAGWMIGDAIPDTEIEPSSDLREVLAVKPAEGGILSQTR